MRILFALTFAALLIAIVYAGLHPHSLFTNPLADLLYTRLNQFYWLLSCPRCVG